MKPLLFDQNLSPRLVTLLSDVFPNSVHVHALGLGTAFDREIWACAQQNDLIIVTKDADYTELGALLGFPPKVVWIRRGNCSTREIEQMLRKNRQAIEELANDPNLGVLEIF
jgi:predicted nuclease of predicted toxin-antitoxin system